MGSFRHATVVSTTLAVGILLLMVAIVSPAAAADSDVNIGVEAGSEVEYGGNETIDIWIGATNTSTSSNAPVNGQDVVVEVENRVTNTVVLNQTVTTNASGYAILTFDASQYADGKYFVRAEGAGETEYDSFNAGIATSDVVLSDSVFVDETTNVTFVTRNGGEPVEGVSRTYEIFDPDGNSVATQTVTSGPGGFSEVTFTPTQAGRYVVRNATNGNYIQSVEAAPYVATLVPEYEPDDQPAGDTVQYAGVLRDGNGPVANQSMTLSIYDRDTDSVLRTLNVTTNSAGIYSAQWEAPHREFNYELRAETGSGQRIEVPSGNWMEIEEPNTYLSGGNTGSSVDLYSRVQASDVDNNIVAPGGNVTISVDANDGTTQISNETVNVTVVFGFDDVPYKTLQLETNSTGEAATTIALPASVPEGSDVRAITSMTYNGSTYVDEGYGPELKRYEVDIDRYTVTAGESNRLNATAKAANGTSVDVPIAVAAMYSDRMEVFDTAFNRTGSDGTAPLPIDVPVDARKSIDINTIYRYGPTNYYRSLDVSEAPANVTTDRQTYQPGDTVTVTFNTSNDSEGIVAVNFDDEYIRYGITPDGQSVDITIPKDVGDDSYLPIEVVAYDSQGRLYRGTTDIDVQRAGPLASFVYEQDAPAPGETVTFDGSGSVADNVTSYEWNFGDGTTTTTQTPTVNHTFQSGGTYNVSLTVTNASGQTDTDAGSVAVESSEPLTVSLTSSPEPVSAGQTLTLDANASGSPTEYRWDFTDDGTIDQTTQTSTLNMEVVNPKNTTVRVTVVNSTGATASDTTGVTIVDNTAPSVALAPLPETAVNESVTLDASNTSDNSYITNYTYEITNESGDVVYSNTTSENTTVVTPPKSGTYTVTVTARDAGENTNSTSEPLVVVDDANLVLDVTAPESTKLDNATTASVTIENTGSKNVTQSVRLIKSVNGSTYDGAVANRTFNESINQTIEPGETVNTTINVTEFVQSNRLVGDVGIGAYVDADDNVTETRKDDNGDSDRVTVTYANPAANVTEVGSPTAATNTTVRAYVHNTGTARSDNTTATVTVTDANGTVVAERANVSIAALAPSERDTISVTADLPAGNYTATANVSDETFPGDNVASTTVTVEPVELSARTTRVPAELEVGQNTTLAFTFETNADATVEATLTVDGSAVSVQASDNATKQVAAEPNQPTLVTYDVSAENVANPETLEVNVSLAGQSATATGTTNVTAVTTVRSNSTATVYNGTSKNRTLVMVGDNRTQAHNVTINVLAGSDGRTLQGLGYLVRYPYGCVEQTTSAYLGALTTDQYYRDRVGGDLTTTQQQEVNESISAGVSRLSPDGVRGQKANGAWNMWGDDDQPGETFYSVYGLLGLSEVSNDPVYGPANDGELSTVDFDEAVTYLDTQDQNDDGSFSAHSYIHDDAAMTGFTMVALNETASHERVTDTTRTNITGIYADSAEYLVGQQASDGSWNGGTAKSTALAIRGLQVALEANATAQSDLNRSEVQAAIDAGQTWLVQNQNADGSWDPYHDSDYWSSQGDISETTAYALLAVNETGVPARNDTVQAGTDYLMSVYEDDGSWGYPRATAVSIDALNKLTLSAGDRQMSVTFTNENGTSISKSVSVNSSTPKRTISLSTSELQTLRPNNGTGNVTVTVSSANSGSGSVIVGVEQRQEVIVEGGGA